MREFGAGVRKDTMRFRLMLAGCAIAAVLATGCGGSLDPAKNTESVFPDDLPPLTSKFYPFTVSQLGELFVTLTSLTPPLANNNLGPDIRVNAVVSGTCPFENQIVAGTSHAIPGQQAFYYPQIPAGQYCLWVSDLGFFTVTEHFVVKVSHP